MTDRARGDNLPTLLDRLRSREAGVIVLRASSREGRLNAAKELARQLERRLDAKSWPSSKYIGETEKNPMDRFRLRADASTVLFFDEADALFGKRTKVEDAHDRYASQDITELIRAADSAGALLILATDSGRVIPRSDTVLAVLDLDRN